jgi:2,5-diketo-D-gluconate reductase A
MKYLMLNNGIEIPIIGLSVFQIPDQAECERTVLNAFRAGYRLIETAASYRNEEAVGEAIRKSAIKRDDLFITTKLSTHDTGYESTKKAFEKSLKNLQSHYVDLYLIHHPYGDIQGSWRAMEELYKEGRAKGHRGKQFSC